MNVGDTLHNAQALVNALAETVQEMEELSVSDTSGGAQAFFDAWADTLEEVEAVPPGDKLDNSQGLNDLLGGTWRHSRQCAVTGRHAG